MKKLILLSVFALAAVGVSAQAWTVDKAHAKLGFSITHLLIADVEGSFKAYDLSFTATKDDFSDAVFELSADIANINTDNEGRDKDLQSANWFDAAQFPKLSFKSTSFAKVEGDKYKLVGDLTIKGITKPVEVMVTMRGPIDRKGRDGTTKKVIGLKFTTVFKRTDFNVGKPQASVGEEVTLNAYGEFSKG